jgi:hypothetical protein
MKPTLLKFYLEHNEDEELTCFFCKTNSCEQSFTVGGSGEIRILGVHSKCVDKHLEKQTKAAG